MVLQLQLQLDLTSIVDEPRRVPALNLPPDLVDVSADFHEYRNTYFLADKLTNFDPATGAGAVTWARNQLSPRIAFSNMENVLRPFDGVTFPEGEYAINPALPFSIQFVSPRTVRIRLQTGPVMRAEEPSPMLVGEPPRDNSWKLSRLAGGYRYTSSAGSVTILTRPWHIEFRDAQGKLLTSTRHTADNLDALFDLIEQRGIDRACFYHLCPAGRGKDLSALFARIVSHVPKPKPVAEAGDAVRYD